jgi:hypothetical protein
MRVLQYSSILFSTVVIHAFYLQNIIYHHLSILITILSILTHAYKNPNLLINIYIRKIDILVAKFTYLYIAINETPKIIINQPLIILCPISIFSIWIFEIIFPKYFVLLHLILHLLAISSMHIYLYYLYY